MRERLLVVRTALGETELLKRTMTLALKLAFVMLFMTMLPEIVGWVYGTVGTAAFLVGSILGGYFTSWLSLKRAMPILLAASVATASGMLTPE